MNGVVDLAHWQSVPDQTTKYQKVKISQPEAKRSLGSTIIRHQKEIRNLVDFYLSRLDTSATLGELIQRSTVYGKGYIEQDLKLREAWFLTLIHVAYAIRVGGSEKTSRHGALQWFFAGTPDLYDVSLGIFHQDSSLLSDLLAKIDVENDTIELLPYICEPLGHITRTDFENSEQSRHKKNKKRAEGVFYTPSDVASFLIGTCGGDDRNETWLDPACGTGIFLREILAQRLDSGPIAKEERAEFFSTLVGVDISDLATDICSFVLLIELLRRDPRGEYSVNDWILIKQHILCADTVSLFAEKDLFSVNDPVGRFFPEGGFSRIVMNPPYSVGLKWKYQGTTLQTILNGTSSGTFDMHNAFLEGSLRLLRRKGKLSAVLPIAVGSNTSREYRIVRTLLAGFSGKKQFLFFDREPQSLFGEDIKTRSLIFFAEAGGQESIYTSGLLKWRQQQRQSIFTKRRGVEISEIDITSFVPKIADESLLLVYKRLRAEPTLDAIGICKVPFPVLSSRTTGQEGLGTLVVAPTAYNFLNVFFVDETNMPHTSTYSSSPQILIEPIANSTRESIFALLSSSFAYWLWLVEGDGFHVNSGFLARLPILRVLDSQAHTQQLSSLGSRLWGQVRMSGQVSTNKGRTNISYHTGFSNKTIHDIDSLVSDYMGFTTDVSISVQEFVASLSTTDSKRVTQFN